MSKFKVGDPVRVTSHKHKYFDQVGVIVAINEGPMTVKFADGKHYWLGEHNLTLADPDVSEVLAEMAEQSGLAAEEDPVSHPPHYTSHPSGVECIEITEHMGFNLGNALKYIWRCDLKLDAIEDLEKARWYIERELAKRKAAQ